MCIGEVTADMEQYRLNHAVKACNVHFAENKSKVQFVLYTSKTHGKESHPQKIKISTEPCYFSSKTSLFCPLQLLHQYKLLRGNYQEEHEQFFIFRGKIPLQPFHARKVLKLCIKRIGLDESLYDFHSFRAGRCVALVKIHNYSIDQVKRFGQWKSNAVYNYLKML